MDEPLDDEGELIIGDFCGVLERVYFFMLDGFKPTSPMPPHMPKERLIDVQKAIHAGIFRIEVHALACAIVENIIENYDERLEEHLREKNL